MHLLVTRPVADAQATCSELEARGHRVTMAPLLEIATDAPPLDVAGVQAFLVTSRNAVRALAAHPDVDRLRRVPMLVVGTGTGAAARAADFNVVLEGNGTGADLAETVKATLEPKRGRLLHVSGDVVAFDLEQALVPAGFQIKRAVVYRSLAVPALPGDIRDALRDGRLDGVILMSPRTASVWCELVRAAGVEDAARRLVHLCLSHGVAKSLNPLAPARIAVARAPSWDEMLALAAGLASSSADGG